MTTRQLFVDGFTAISDFEISLQTVRKESDDGSDELDENIENTPDQPSDSGNEVANNTPQEVETPSSVGEVDELEPGNQPSPSSPPDSGQPGALDEDEKDEPDGESDSSYGTQPTQSTDQTVVDESGVEQVGDQSPDTPKHSRKRLWISVVVALVLIAVVAVLGVSFYLKDKAMPNSFVAGENVSYMTKPEIINTLENRQKTVKITFVGNEKDKLHLATHADVGLKFDTDKVANEALSLHRTGGILDRIKVWERQSLSLEPRIDSKVLASYIKKEIKSSSSAPVNAKITFDSKIGKFVTQKDKDGSGVLAEKAANALKDSASRGESAKIDVPTQAIPADIQAEALVDDLQTANSYLASDIMISISGTNIRPSQSDKASWLKLKLNDKKHYTTEVREDLIKQYVANVVGPYHQDTKEQISIKDKKTGKTTVLQAGTNGRSVTNQAEITANLTSAFSEKQAYSGEAKIADTKFKNKDLNSFSKWALVILSQQRLTAYEYAKPVKSFTISSGVPQYPSDVGVFKVWYKTAVQTMTGGSLVGGDYYSLPNVHWNTYYNGDEAVHEAYWHNNFGTPMSHGCLNSRLADAKWFYDFAPIGTTVVVLP